MNNLKCVKLEDCLAFWDSQNFRGDLHCEYCIREQYEDE